MINSSCYSACCLPTRAHLGLVLSCAQVRLLVLMSHQFRLIWNVCHDFQSFRYQSSTFIAICLWPIHTGWLLWIAACECWSFWRLVNLQTSKLHIWPNGIPRSQLLLHLMTSKYVFASLDNASRFSWMHVCEINIFARFLAVGFGLINYTRILSFHENTIFNRIADDLWSIKMTHTSLMNRRHGTILG